jgi:hypothetical protein
MPKIALKVTHTHAGVVYPVGHVIEVDEHTARWLIARKVGEPATPSFAPAQKKSPAERVRSAQTHKE